jgi:hypothetical protein
MTLETRANLYQRASAEAFAALQQAAIDALDTVSVVNDAVALLEASRSIEPDERTAIIAILQLIPAVRMERAAEQAAKEQG